MKKYLLGYILIGILFSTVFVSSCSEDLYEESFREFKLRFDYHQKGNCVSFEIYKESPLYEDESTGTLSKRADISPILSGTTDENGKYTGTIIESEQLKVVYLYAEIDGNMSCVKITFSGDNISASIG